MKHTEDSNGSNYCLEESFPGSGQFSLCIRDVTTFFRGLTYGFCLDIPDDFPEHFLDVIKPRLAYADFGYGKVLTVSSAIGAAAWMALPLDDKKFLSQCQLLKVGPAHIELQRIA